MQTAQPSLPRRWTAVLGTILLLTLADAVGPAVAAGSTIVSVAEQPASDSGAGDVTDVAPSDEDRVTDPGDDDVTDPGDESAPPTPDPDPDPDPTATPEPTGTESPEPTEEPTPDPTTTEEPSPSPTTSEEPTPEPTPTPVPTVTVTPVPAVPPAVATSTTSLATILIAAGVLVAAGLFLFLLIRRQPKHLPAAPDAPGSVDATPTPIVLNAMATLGTAMIDSGYPVGIVRGALEDMARVNGTPHADAVVFPTSILVSAGDGSAAQTRAVSAGESAALLYQVDRVDRLAGVARTTPGAAAWVRESVDRVATLAPPFTRLQRLGGYTVLSAALAVLLGSSWLGVALATVLGFAVGAVLLWTANLAATYQALVVVAVSLGVGLITLLVAHTLDANALPAIIAPLVMLLPGGLLTIAAIELATGHIMSGAARAAAGAMRLLLLATGIVAAAALVGIPSLPTTGSSDHLGPIMPWIAVAVFGLGITVYQCARPASIGWIMVVLYVAYGAQVLGDIFFQGVLSALVGAAAMAPVAVAIAKQRTGPPALVSFLPAFWLLVPGALGLIGVTAALDGGADGLSTIVSTIATMIAIALGVLIGLALAGSLNGLDNSPLDDEDDVELTAQAAQR